MRYFLSISREWNALLVVSPLVSTNSLEETEAALTGADKFIATCVRALFSLQWRDNECDGVSNHRRRWFAQPFVHAQIKQNSASLAYVRWIRRLPVNSPHKKPVTRKMFPFNDVIMS